MKTKSEAMFKEALRGIVVDICQDGKEREDFRRYLIDNDGTLTDEQRSTLIEDKDEAAVQEILEQAASDPEQAHIWATTHRLRHNYLA